jgi:GR25 family glycosyltransferase involved in LPS biosynthesis
VGISDDSVRIMTFTPDDNNRVRGCYTSHVATMKEIAKKYKKNPGYKALILEDNLEATGSPNLENVLQKLDLFTNNKDYGAWDVIHLAVMMYVPGLVMERLEESDPSADHIIRMITKPESAVGTSAYLISKSGVDKIIRDANTNEEWNGEAIPNVMAKLFPESRFAAYPMIFHRAAKVGSLVNPQLDDFRRVMFSRSMYTTWEKLMVSSGWGNEKILPMVGGSVGTALLGVLGVGAAGIFPSLPSEFGWVANVMAISPLAVLAWGVTLFSTSAGYASGQKKVVDDLKGEAQ